MPLKIYGSRKQIVHINNQNDAMEINVSIQISFILM